MDNERFATREEFEVFYAANSGVTVDDLHGWGLYAVPCDCGEPGCRGWQLRYLATLLPNLDPAAEHIPDDWDVQELVDALIADGQTELVQLARETMRELRS